MSGSGGRDSNRTRFGVGDTIRFNRDGTREVVRTAPETQAVAQGQSVAGATQTIAGGTAADAATSNESSTGGVTQLPTSSQGPTILPLCTDECPRGSGTQSLPRIGGVIAPLKSVEGIARIFELCSLAPGIGSACAVGAAATRFGQGRFGEAGDNLLNIVPFLGIVRRTDKAADVAKGAHAVYHGVDAAGVVRYVGITSRGVATRADEHLRAIGTGKELLDYRIVKGAEALTKMQARIWEQKLILEHGLGKNGGTLLNRINSIAPKYWNQYGIGP